MTTTALQIEMWTLDRVRPYENNPRNNDKAVDAVAASIKEFGFSQPIVVDNDSVIIVGHTRLKAAQKLGLERVPVVVATHLTPEQVRAYRIADNKTAEIAEWNYDLLPIELSALQEANYDLGLLGFNAEELAKLMDTGVNEGLTDPDEIPEPPDEAVTQSGDLWILGKPSIALWQLLITGGLGPFAGRRCDPPCQYRSALQREGRTAIEQCDRRWLVIFHQRWSCIEAQGWPR